MNIPAREILLQPGQWWFGSDASQLRTVLGSCVAITLWHPQRRLGGMCHYMLPGRAAASGARPGGCDGRYGDEVIAGLRQEIERRAGVPGEYEAKLFGGARMFSVPNGLDGSNVSDRNVQAGRELLSRHGFACKAEHVGGHGHREVILQLRDGHVWVRQTPLRDIGRPVSAFGALT